MDDLRRLTVRVLLVVLVITVVGDFVDSWWFNNRYDALPIFTLVGGMVSGLFAPELLRTLNSRNEEKPPPPPPLPSKESKEAAPDA